MSANTKGGEEDSVAGAVLRQVEYYFSDESYPFDEYMKSKCDENGWIDIDEIAAFPKMRQLTKEKIVITEALATSDSVKVSEDGKRIGRKFPTPDTDPDADRTIYCTGFASSTDKASLESTIRTWTEKHGTVESLRVLRNLSKEGRLLDGSAFVKYESTESVGNAVDATGTVSKGHKITVYTLSDYFERIQKKKESIAKKKKEKEESGEEEKQITPIVVEGSVLSLTFTEPKQAESLVRDELKALFAKTPEAVIRYVEFNPGDPVAYIRFESNEQARAALDAFTSDPVALKDNIQLQVALLQGQAELDYIERANEAKRAANKRKGGRKGGRGKRARH